MIDKNKNINSIRQKAEDIVNAKSIRIFNNLDKICTDKLKILVHELEVHQIELEMQNDELLRSQHELSEMKSRYFELYNLAPVAYLTLSEEGLIQEANLTTSKMLGINRNKLIKRLFTSFIPKDYQDTYYLFYRKLLKSHKYEECQIQLIKFDKTVFWVQICASVESFGNRLEFRFLLKDISESKEAEKNLEIAKQKLNKLNHTLEERVNKEIEKNIEKTICMLQQSRLAQMGEMISMIAHQWRQPLTAISTTSINLQMRLDLEVFDLESKEGIKKANNYLMQELQSIDFYVNNLTNTIDSFRNFYKQDKESVRVKAESIILETLRIIKPSLLNDNIEIIEEYDSNIEIDFFDGEMMQVILNILTNSQDSFKEKQIKYPYIRITTKHRTISICDNAGGIAEEILGKIFDPYFSTKKKKDGTGLGLYMSKIIVEEHHNGKLSAKNKNNGACFTIAL